MIANLSLMSTIRLQQIQASQLHKAISRGRMQLFPRARNFLLDAFFLFHPEPIIVNKNRTTIIAQMVIGYLSHMDKRLKPGQKQDSYPDDGEVATVQASISVSHINIINFAGIPGTSSYQKSITIDFTTKVMFYRAVS